MTVVTANENVFPYLGQNFKHRHSMVEINPFRQQRLLHTLLTAWKSDILVVTNEFRNGQIAKVCISLRPKLKLITSQ